MRVIIFLFVLFSQSAFSSVVFDKVGRWEKRVIRTPSGIEVHEGVRLRNNNGDLLVIQGDEGGKKYVSIIPVGYLKCSPAPFITISSGNEKKILTTDCNGDGLMYQSVIADIDDPVFFEFLLKSDELTLTTYSGDVNFDIGDNPY